MTERYNDRKLRFALVGCGAVGPTHAAAISRIDDAELVAVSDLLPERAQKVAEKFNVPRIYSNLERVLADGDIDVVSLCTPTGAHAQGAIAAMQAGKHVIVEKPMEVSLEACDRMIDEEDKTGMKLTVISQHRFDAATIQVKRMIDSGELGKIILADASVKWWRTQQYYDSGDWRGTWAMDGGGSLMNQGVHTVDVLQWLAGGVASIFAHVRTAAHERIEVEDLAVAALTFRNGAVGTLTATTAAYDGQPVQIEVYGTEGSAVLKGDNLSRLVLKSGKKFESGEAAPHAVSVAQGGTNSVKDEASVRKASAAQGTTWGDAHRAQIRDLIHAIRTDAKPLIDGRAARKPVEVIIAAYRSSREGIAVKLD